MTTHFDASLGSQPSYMYYGDGLDVLRATRKRKNNFFWERFAC